MKFSELGLVPQLLRALEDCGYTDATEIQTKTIQGFGDGNHIVGQSQTGSGKTAAFVLPILNAIDTTKRLPQALILAPTRELAAQIREEIFMLSKYMNMLSLTAVGGTSKRKQIDLLRKGPQIIVGTPGRVEDLLDSHKIKPSDIKYFVIDEVDRMLDMGFIDSIRSIWQRLDTVKQVLTYSATFPVEAKALVSQFIGNDYTLIKISEQLVVDNVNHLFVNISKEHKYEFLKELLTNNPQFKVIVFAETKRRVDRLAQDLQRDGFSAMAIHGDMEQRERFHTLKSIKNNECRVLVATDVAARGLNMNDVNLVVNYEVPNDPESYVHRIGRTARAGSSGDALMFVGNDEWNLLHSIERKNKIRIEQINQAGDTVERTDRPQRNAGSNGRSRFRRGGSGGGGSRGRRTSGRTSASGRTRTQSEHASSDIGHARPRRKKTPGSRNERPF